MASSFCMSHWLREIVCSEKPKPSPVQGWHTILALLPRLLLAFARIRHCLPHRLYVGSKLVFLAVKCRHPGLPSLWKRFCGIRNITWCQLAVLVFWKQRIYLGASDSPAAWQPDEWNLSVFKLYFFNPNYFPIPIHAYEKGKTNPCAFYRNRLWGSSPAGKHRFRADATRAATRPRRANEPARGAAPSFRTSGC